MLGPALTPGVDERERSSAAQDAPHADGGAPRPKQAAVYFGLG